MRKKSPKKAQKSVGSIWTLIALTSIVWAPRLSPQEKAGPVFLSCSQADLVIHDEKLGPGSLPTRILFLDFNRDGIKDLAIIGESRRVFESGIKIHFFDGSSLGGNKALRFEDAKALLGGLNVFGADKGYLAGDFNGDGCDDLLVGKAGGDKGAAFFVLLGSPDFFSKKLADAGDKAAYFSELADLEIFSSSGNDFYDSGVEGYLENTAIGDVNNDGKDDIVISSPYADAKNGRGEKLKNAGKVFVVHGKDSFPKQIDLSTQADLTLIGTAYSLLGKSLWSERAGVGNDAKINFWIKSAVKHYIVADVAKLSGIQFIEEIPGIVQLFGQGSLFRIMDFNGDGVIDRLIHAPYSSMTNVRDRAHPVLRVIYGRDQPLESMKQLSDLADIQIVCRPQRGTEEIEVVDIDDVNASGKPDVLIRELRRNDYVYDLVLDPIDKGAVIDLKDADRIITKTSEGLKFLLGVDLDGNQKDDTVISDPWATHKKGYLPLEACGKVYIFFDRELTYDQAIDADFFNKIVFEANMVITGEENNDMIGTVVYVHDVSGDGLADLIVLAPFKDTKKSLMERRFRSAIYIFFGENLHRN